MKNLDNYTDYLISKRVYEMLFNLEIERLHHRNCDRSIHHIFYTDIGLMIGHEEDIDLSNTSPLFSFVDTNISFFSDAQRETLIERLTDLIRSLL